MSILRSWSLRNKLLLFAAALIVLPGTLFGVVSERTATPRHDDPEAGS